MNHYVIHLDLADWLDQADTTTADVQPIYIQETASTEIAHDLPVAILSQLVGSYADAAGVIHAIRIVVERASLLEHDHHAVRAAVLTRAAQAKAIAGTAIGRRYPGAIAGGILLTPGLRPDLAHYQTDHQLWNWTGDQRSPLKRALIAKEEL